MENLALALILCGGNPVHIIIDQNTYWILLRVRVCGSNVCGSNVFLFSMYSGYFNDTLMILEVLVEIAVSACLIIYMNSLRFLSANTTGCSH